MPDAFEPTGEMRLAKYREWLFNGLFLVQCITASTDGEYPIYRRVPCDPAAAMEAECERAFARMHDAFYWSADVGKWLQEYTPLINRFIVHRERTPALASDMRELTAKMKGTSDA